MVAQVILVHFVEVRILAGLPFFMAERRSIFQRNILTLNKLLPFLRLMEESAPVSPFSSPCTLFRVPNGSIN